MHLLKDVSLKTAFLPPHEWVPHLFCQPYLPAVKGRRYIIPLWGDLSFYLRHGHIIGHLNEGNIFGIYLCGGIMGRTLHFYSYSVASGSMLASTRWPQGRHKLLLTLLVWVIHFVYRCWQSSRNCHILAAVSLTVYFAIINHFWCLCKARTQKWGHDAQPSDWVSYT